ncbi:uncharacterized protein (DUF952 family) [Roseibium hamelinense]|uniref:Uncharacterized protein (DUF952 family) n=1 Tax=Roseibium hamelinense TaxID=150831 RepID=A0A562SUD1_9HYPH|nr:DUF952 domain-containing protein [Roseibium hamelinense]MTI43049.1 DUF952 domain-containing protein [Roseibium hamelinense]TWI84648.1 uncharacterized protein (DUF952 family) [Roseibium hamelinense]
MARIFKIVPKAMWQDAEAAGVFRGAPIDVADGYIHFSSADQVRETAEKHFSGQADLLLAAFDESSFDSNLKWEPSRDGDLFPHLYGSLDVKLAIWVKPLPMRADGSHVFPDLDA